MTLRLSGRVFTGGGYGARYTQLGWARAQLTAALGVDPFPGTLNLILEGPQALASWRTLQSTPQRTVVAPANDGCDAHCYPVRIAERFPGAIVRPSLPGYPRDQLELVASLPLRQTLAIDDGDTLLLEVTGPVVARAVIFDVDGTLVDSLGVFADVAMRVAERFDIALEPAVVREVLNYHIPRFWERVIPRRRGNRDAIAAAMMAEARREWPEALAAGAALFPDAATTLTGLARAGWRLGIVTGSEGDSLEPLRAAGLLDLCQAVITARDVKHGKPDPEGLLRCAAHLGVAPGESVYVGDSVADMRATQAAGMMGIAVLSGAGDCATLTSEGPHRILQRLEQLPTALELATAGSSTVATADTARFATGGST